MRLGSYTLPEQAQLKELRLFHVLDRSRQISPHATSALDLSLFVLEILQVRRRRAGFSAAAFGLLSLVALLVTPRDCSCIV